MPCSYYNAEKDNIGDGIYCNKIGGRPGVSYWRPYCDGCPSDCPYNDGPDPQELHPDTRERNRVIRKIDNLPSRITVQDGDRISDARWAYDHLSYKQQRYVSNYGKLAAAERAYQNALAQEEAERQAEYRRQQEEKRARQQEARDARQKQTDTASRDNTGGQSSPGRRKGYVTNLITGQQRKLTPWERFLNRVKFATDPKIKNTSWWIRAYRFVLPTLAWIDVFARRGTSLPVEIILLTAFATLQLISFALAYAATDSIKLRAGFWTVEGILLAILGILIWLNLTTAIAMEVLVILFVYPVLLLGYWLLAKIFGVVI